MVRSSLCATTTTVALVLQLKISYLGEEQTIHACWNLNILDKKKRWTLCAEEFEAYVVALGRWHVRHEPWYSRRLLRPGGLPSEGFRLHGELGAGSKKLDEQRTSLEKKINQLDLDIDMMIMDVESSNNQVTIMSSEKAYFDVQVDAFGKESEVKTKEVAASGRPGSERAQGSAAVLWACVGQQSF